MKITNMGTKMFKQWLIIIVSHLVYFSLNGQYDLTTIPDSLSKNAHAIILNQESKTEIFSKKLIKNKTTIQSLILNQNAEEATQIVICYNNFKKINDISLEIWSPLGKKLKTIKKREMTDLSTVTNSTIASDHRCIIYKASEMVLPYIIQLAYSTTSTQSLNLEPLPILLGEKTSILKSTYEIVNYDTLNKLRFTENVWGQPKAIKTKSSQNYVYEIQNITVSKIAEITNNDLEANITPILENFEMDEVPGEMKSWQTFGEWISKLNEGRDVLDASSQSEIKQIIGDEKDKKVIIQKLYSYLQHHMRYVGIQLGIGGFKPMLAQDVHQFKYGDCKALSNYMKTLLQIAHIPSYYVIIQAGTVPQKMNVNQVHNFFNHAILAVPMDHDTIFLECTSDTNPFGYQGSFTGNRSALMIDGANSKLINTTPYGYKQNIIANNIKISDIQGGTPSILLSQSLQGIGIEYLGYHFLPHSSDEKFLMHLIDAGIGSAENLKIVKRAFPNYYEYTFNASKKILKTGSRYFIDLNFASLPNSIQKDQMNNFKTIRIGYTIHDHYQIDMPKGCVVEKIPKDLSVENESIRIEIKTTVNDSSVMYDRMIEFKEGSYADAEQEIVNPMVAKLKKIANEKMVINCKN